MTQPTVSTSSSHSRLSDVEEGLKAIAITDPQGRILDVNRAFTRITGYTRREVVGQSLSLLNCGDGDKKCAEVLWAKALKTGHWAGPVKHKHNDGTILDDWMDLSITRNGHGKITNVIAYFHKASANMPTSTQALAQTQRIKEDNVLYAAALRSQPEKVDESLELLARANHEMRTPLNTIIGFSEMIASEVYGPIDNKKYQDYARIIQQSGQHLLQLVDTVLDQVKVDNGKHRLDLSPVEIAPLLEQSLSMVSLQASEKNVTVTSSIAPGPTTITADPLKIRQILINLLANAVDHTKPGGHVNLNGGLGPIGSYLFTVRDTGIGITQEDLIKALDPSTQDGEGGEDKNALGLPLAKALTELHGGTFEIESELDVGTTVYVSLPASQAAQNT